ncbi:MAG: dTMP kinase [Chloroflexi bacterium]|nr:MAG: dTMP kinase [Chloroflexota bacterium]
MAAAQSRGIFVTLEGGEGSGKTTLAAAIGEFFVDQGEPVCLTREPGGTELGSRIESILEGKEESSPLSALAELLLFEADRVQHVLEVIVPALTAGQIVVCDRFTDSSLAYQGYGRGLDLNLIRRFNDEATGGVAPHLTLLLDVPPEQGLSRDGVQKDVTGRENVEFHQSVRAGFLELAHAEPERFVVIDGGRAIEEVRAEAIAAVTEKVSQIRGATG